VLSGYLQCLDAPQGVEGPVRQRLDVVIIQRPVTKAQAVSMDTPPGRCTGSTGR